MSDHQPGKRLLKLAVADAVKTRLISKSAFKNELKKPRKLHSKCSTNEEDVYQSMTNLLPQGMINLMREIDKQKQQDSQCKHFYRKPYNQEHSMNLNDAGTSNEKIRYFNLGEEQGLRSEGCERNNELVTNYVCDKTFYSQYSGSKIDTNTSNLTSTNRDLSDGELQGCDYMNRDFQILPSKYGSEGTCNASEVEFLNMCPESLLIKDIYPDIKSEHDFNQSTMPSVAEKVPFMLQRKSSSNLSCSGLETNDLMNSPSLLLSNEVTNMESTINKNVMSEESQSFKECMDKISRLGLEPNIQSTSCDSGINYLSMAKESSAHSTNQNPFDTTKQSDSPKTILNSDFNHILDLDCANRYFQTNSEFFTSDGPSGSNVEISHGRNEVSKSTNFDINVDFYDRTYKHNYLANNENSRFCSFFEKHQNETFESTFQCVPQNSYSNFESDNAVYTSSSIYSPKTNNLEETNVYKNFNDHLSFDEIKTCKDVPFSMKCASGLDSNSKAFSLNKHSEFAIKISTDTLCSRHVAEKSFSKEMEKCQVFKNGCINSNEMHLSNGLRNSKRENFDFQYLSQNEFYVSFDKDKVSSTNPLVSFNTDDYKIFNSSFDCESNILQHFKLEDFNESKEIKKYISSECESDYINDLINELM